MSLLGMGDHILDIAVTPDRGYALSVRGVAREVASAFGVEFLDPAVNFAPELSAPTGGIAPHEALIDDFSVCEMITLRTVTGFNPDAPTPPVHRCAVTSLWHS